jgi:serine/threonine protein kinase
VFRAYDSGRDRLVAVKVFRLDLTAAQIAALVSHFEALVDAGIDHPNIAAPIATGVEGPAAYLAQEYAIGDSLDVMLRERGALSVQEAVTLVASLAAAIDHAAARGIRHGSLHLRDIIVSADGARITGFGVAPALSMISAKLPTRPQYSSPDGASDVYSLAAIAFEAITGTRASDDNLKMFESEHGFDLRAPFDRALLADREERPQRAGDFADMLRSAATTTRRDERSPRHEPAETVEAPVEGPSIVPDVWIGAADDFDVRIDRADDEPPGIFQSADQPGEPRRRRWPVAVMFIGIAAAAALVVGFLLKSPTPVAMPDAKGGVAETTVDLPSTPGQASPRRPAREGAPTTPPPSPSRSASGAVARTQSPTRGSLLIRSTPADAEVLVNGRVRGKTPLTIRELELGSYTIRVALSGYATEERDFELTARRPTAATLFTLRRPAAETIQTGDGGINVQSRPAGARVFVNDRPVGSTPLTIPTLPAGPASVRLELDGYRTWSTTIRIAPGPPTRVAASLERNPNP